MMNEPPKITVTNWEDLPEAQQSTESVGVPPIRSLSFRQSVHYPSNSNLQLSRKESGDGSGPADNPSGSTSSTITEAISHLESLLEEAGHISQLLGVPTERTNHAQSGRPPSIHRTRKPSDRILSKGKMYLQSANTKRQSAVRFREEAASAQPSREATHALPDHTVPSHSSDLHLHDETVRTEAAKTSTKVSAIEPAFDSSSPSPSKAAVKQRRSLDNLEAAERTLVDSTQLASRLTDSKQNIKDKVRSDTKMPVVQPKPTMLGLGIPPALNINIGWLNNQGSNKAQRESLEPSEECKPYSGHFLQVSNVTCREASIDMAHESNPTDITIHLRRKTHVDLFNTPDRFDVHESCHHKPVAKNWPDSRKRFTAIVVCINSTCLGILIGIYAGEVPAIQYQIADFGHLTILGNVCLYIGLALTTLICWPLPLLHGRKPYTLAGLALAFALQIPQGIVVSQWRLPSQITWRLILLLCRALTGIAFGFVTINVQSSLLDVFGASLQSRHPQGESVDLYDIRRHGGGMGMWLGAWSWCTIGPISLGFVIGAFIISTTAVQWGFWVGLFILMFVLFLNLIAPETRRSAFRRTIAEMTGASGSFSRVTRGEVKMHIKAVGPYWWGEEVLAGLEMCYLMIKQPGFLILALYSAWTYAQFTLVMMLMGALTSRLYQYRPSWVGICALSLGGGAILAVPFQKASIFSRSRKEKFRTDSMTFQRSGFWASHTVRQILFTVATPLAATGFACTTWGPPFPVAVPCALAAGVGYMSTLVTAECFGLTMEVFDISDLQPRMTGRTYQEPECDSHRKQGTNFTCYPRVSAGMAVIQSMGYSLAAAATGLGGRVERSIGIMQASGAVAGILLLLTALLIAVLARWKSVRVITDPTDHRARRREPLILGNLCSVMRKINVLEAGGQTRFSEIRRQNRLNTGIMSGD